jgi:cation diffusion facilitator family transporter
MVHVDKIQTANRQIRAVTNLGIVVNISLTVLKVLVGFLAGSLALIADGLHSLSDIATDVAVLLGVYFGSKKPDDRHPYGHGRIETFSSGFIGVVLVLVGVTMIYYAAIDIVKGRVVKPSIAVFVIALISVLSKEVLYRLTKKVAVRSHSSALYANAWHHRSDALSSIAVIIGSVSLKLGFIYGDQIAAVAVGLMIIFVGVRVLGDCFAELAESAVDSGIVEQIKALIASESRIRQWHKLRTRMVGREIFLDLHILVEPSLNITEAHEIAENLETILHEQIPRPVNITVHIEPDKPELRK